MNIVFFTHPAFLNHQSMLRFARMLSEGMAARGHSVTVLYPHSFLYNLRFPWVIRKWLGYVDQYIIFPVQVRHVIKKLPDKTLFIFTDHALGPWVPLVADKPHVIHCHDFLAQQAANGEIKENKTSWLGRLYQRYIYAGYSRGKYFISVSHKTKVDLHNFLTYSPACSEVVYNGLDSFFTASDVMLARAYLGEKFTLDLSQGYLLHVGGNQWYKNRVGVIEIYFAWRSSTGVNLPLLLVGEPPTADLLSMCHKSPYKHDVHWLTTLNDDYLQLAYSGASVLLFPSLAEGFGWPIAEAMASGCPVITTDEAPMTEVAGEAGFFIPRRPIHPSEIVEWSSTASRLLNMVLTLPSEEREKIVAAGLRNVARFNSKDTLDKIEKIYLKVFEMAESAT